MAYVGLGASIDDFRLRRQREVWAGDEDSRGTAGKGWFEEFGGAIEPLAPTPVVYPPVNGPIDDTPIEGDGTPFGPGPPLTQPYVEPAVIEPIATAAVSPMLDLSEFEGKGQEDDDFGGGSVYVPPVYVEPVVAEYVPPPEDIEPPEEIEPTAAPDPAQPFCPPGQIPKPDGDGCYEPCPMRSQSYNAITGQCEDISCPPGFFPGAYGICVELVLTDEGPIGVPYVEPEPEATAQIKPIIGSDDDQISWDDVTKRDEEYVYEPAIITTCAPGWTMVAGQCVPMAEEEPTYPADKENGGDKYEYEPLVDTWEDIYEPPEMPRDPDDDGDTFEKGEPGDVLGDGTLYEPPDTEEEPVIDSGSGVFYGPDAPGERTDIGTEGTTVIETGPLGPGGPGPPPPPLGTPPLVPQNVGDSVPGDGFGLIGVLVAGGLAWVLSESYRRA